MLTGPTLDQSSQLLNLRWTQGDPVSLAATIQGGSSWAGSYTVESDTAGIAGLVAAVVADGADALLTLTMTAGASAPIAAGVYRWRLQQTGGPTRLSGRVEVTSD